MAAGTRIAGKIGYATMIKIGCVIVCSSVFISTFFLNFWVFVFFYGIMFGLTNGALYILPVKLTGLYFPHRGGLVSGIIVAGFGMGSFLW